MRRIMLLFLIGLALLSLVVYSQYRQAPDYVSGIVEAEEIRLGSRVGGRVKTVHVQEGDSVSPSMQLVEFEPYDMLERERQAISLLAEKEALLKKAMAGMRAEEIAQAETRYDEAVAQLSLIKEGPRQEEIAAAENRLVAAKADLERATREYQRQASLRESEAVSKSDYERAEEQYRVSLAIREVRRNELAILESGARAQEIQMAAAKMEDLRLAWELAKLGFRSEDIEQARASRDAAAAALEAIRQQKSELTVFAPSVGTVDSLDLLPGDLVPPNAPMMTILSSRELWVRAYVPQRFLQIQMGQTLRVTLDSFPGQDFAGEVTFISHLAEFTPSNVQTPDDRAKQVYRIRVALHDDAGKLRPGMTANVWLDSASSTK